MLPEISVIIPVYNGAKTLKRCVESILNQKYPNTSIIIVNDGSTDSTKAICENYAERYHNIQIVNKANAGLPSARISGIQLLPEKGLTMFLDSDDYLFEGAIDKLFDLYNKTNADISCGTVCKAFGHLIKRKSVPSLFNRVKVYEKEEFVDTILPGFFGVTSFPGYMHTKLYKNDCIRKGLLFEKPVLFFQEDIAFNLQLVQQVDSIAVMPDPVCYYTQSGGTSKWMPSFLSDCISLYNFKLKCINKYSYPDSFKYTTHIELKNELFTYLDMYMNQIKGSNKTVLLDEIKRCVELHEIQEALKYSVNDFSGVPGFRDSLVSGNYEEAIRLLRKYHCTRMIKGFILNLITRI